MFEALALRVYWCLLGAAVVMIAVLILTNVAGPSLLLVEFFLVVCASLVNLRLKKIRSRAEDD